MKESWTQDYYDANNPTKIISATPGYRTRSPFIPFALKNETGSTLRYSTFISDTNDTNEIVEPNSKWPEVPPGGTVAFSFKAHDKIRHSDSHKMRMHQLCVQVDGYKSVKPVTIDKVGTYFRHAEYIQHKLDEELPSARVVFDVALEGSARKLITVRSALLLTNKLPEKIEVKLESQLYVDPSLPKCWTLNPNVTFALPIVQAHSLISVRPASNKQMYTFSPQISWEAVTRANDVLYELRACNTNRGQVYR